VACKSTAASCLNIGTLIFSQYLWNSVLGLTQEQFDDLPESHRKKIECLGLGVGKKDLWDLNDAMVWDLLSIQKDSPESKCD
jgi:hypothetical protein